MSNDILAGPTELTAAEIDAVSGGANNNNRQAGLVNANVQDVNVLVAVQALTSSSALTPVLTA